jgi:hypothetical protein
MKDTHVALEIKGHRGMVVTETMLRDEWISLRKMIDPIERGAPIWCVR